jgi:serine/threonine protein kinase
VNIDLIEQHGFKLLDLIEETSRVIIWKAVQTTLDRSVFLVILKEEAAADPLEVKYFLQIAQQFAKLKNDSLAAVFDIISENDSHYAIMEYVDGQNLDELLESHGPLEFEHIMQVALSVTGCLQQLWNNSRIIHRNLKGSTIRYDSRGIAKITDFSLAVISSKDFDSSIIDKGHILGSPSFLSPEQSRADETIAPQSDMYALGALLYYLATGKAPFSEHNGSEILNAHLLSQLSPPHLKNAKLPAIFSKLLHKLMMKDPAYRYKNWEEIQHDLHSIIAHREPVCLHLNLKHASTIKPDFTEKITADEQPVYKIKTKKRNEYLSSMQDKHVSHHHEADKKSQQLKTQLICWAGLALWFVALFWFRAVIQTTPVAQQKPDNQSNSVIDSPGSQELTPSQAGPTSANSSNSAKSSTKINKKISQKMPTELMQTLAKALANNSPASAINTLRNATEDFSEKNEVLALLIEIPSSDQLVTQHLLNNTGKSLVMNFKGKPRKVIPKGVKNNIVQLEAKGRSIDLNISKLNIEQKINWINPPANTAENIATLLLYLQKGDTKQARKYADKCGLLTEVAIEAVEIKTTVNNLVQEF